MSDLSSSKQVTVLFSIYQNNTWIIRCLIYETIEPVTQRIILKIVVFLSRTGPTLPWKCWQKYWIGRDIGTVGDLWFVLLIMSMCIVELQIATWIVWQHQTPVWIYAVSVLLIIKGYWQKNCCPGPSNELVPQIPNWSFLGGLYLFCASIRFLAYPGQDILMVLFYYLHWFW